MNCKNHPNREAVGQCSECGVGLCEECYNILDPALCYECATKIYNSDKKQQQKLLISFIVCGVVGLAIGLGICIGIKAPAWFIYVFAALWGFMGGSSFGMAIIANRGSNMHWVSYLVMFLLAVAIAPVYFIIRLVRQIKLLKSIKAEKKLIDEYPADHR